MIEELRKLRELTEALTGNGYLRDQAEEWEYALNAIPECVYIIDTNHNLKFINKVLAQRLGARKEALFNRKCYDIIKGVSGPHICEEDSGFPCCDIDVTGEYTAKKDIYLENLRGWFIYGRSPIYTKDNTLIGFICILRDVTERRRLEEETLRKQKVLSTVFNTAPICMGLLERGTRRLIEVNDFMCGLLGYDKEELVGCTALKLYPSEEEYLRVGEVKYPQIERTGTGKVETKFVTKSGKVLDIELTTSKTGNPKELVFTAVDITERKRSADRMQALLDLSNMVDASEEELIAFVLERAVELTDSKIGYMHFVDNDGNGDINLNLFKWSKQVEISCKAERVSHYPLEKAGIWADCIRTGEPVVHNDYPSVVEKGGLPDGHVSLERHMSVPVRDGDKIVAILGVGNKTELYDEGDVRQLSLFLYTMWDIIKGKRLEFHIHNLVDRMPVGILSYKLVKDDLILKAFNPAAKKILKLDLGATVGRAIGSIFPKLATSEVVNIFKGLAKFGGVWEDLEFHHSDEETGVSGVFSVLAFQIFEGEVAVFFSDVTKHIETTKALYAVSARLAKARESLKEDLKKFSEKFEDPRRVLIVEDNEMVSNLVKHFVSSEGFEVRVAYNGEEAVHYIDTNGICLVVVDLTLPGNLTGFDVIRKVVEHNNTVPIIVVSGTPEVLDINDAMAAGAWDYLSKPITKEALLESVRKNLAMSHLIKRSHRLDEFIEATK